MKLPRKYYRLRSAYWRHKRLLFPSPAELLFIELMGGRVMRVPIIRNPQTKFCMAFVCNLGPVLTAEFVEREIRVGRCYIDFGARTRAGKLGIEIDGAQWHRDIVKEQNREDYLRWFGWRILHVTPREIIRNPESTFIRILQFFQWID